MAAPFRIHQSELPLPHERAGHVAVTWNKATIIWGGRTSDQTITDSDVYMHLSGKWIRKETSGNVPSETRDVTAHIVDDTMFVLVPNGANPSEILYSLDLFTWTWTKLAPSGTPPKSRMWTSSWVHNGRIYVLGGMAIQVYHEVATLMMGLPPSKQLFCYNPDENSWEWPSQGGDIPTPRSRHSAIINDNTVFLFGGESLARGFKTHNDLHILDMERMIWTRVHDSMSEDQVPGNMHKVPYGGTLVRISQSTAVLFGRFTKGSGENDFWLLNLESAKQLEGTSSIWTKIQGHPFTYGYAAVLEPMSRKLWVIGGSKPSKPTPGRVSALYGSGTLTSEVLIMPLNPSLKDLALASVARNICLKDPRLAPDQLPSQVRDDIDAYRAEIGGRYLCSQEKRCLDCLTDEEPPTKRARKS